MSESESLRLIGGDSLVSRKSLAKWEFISLINLGFAFLFICTAFDGVAAISSSFVPNNLGFYSLALSFLFFCIGTVFLVQLLLPYVSGKWGMVIGSLMYISYVITTLLRTPWYILLPSSAVGGLSASLLWTCQGPYIIQSAKRYSLLRDQSVDTSMATFNGVFVAFVQLSLVSGNLLSSFLFHLDSSGRYLLYASAGCCVVGTLLLILLRSPPDNDLHFHVELPRKTVYSILTSMKLLTSSREFLLLIPLILYTGIESLYISGTFTFQLIYRSGYGLEDIGYAVKIFRMAVYGAASVAASFILAPFANSVVGRRTIFFFGLATHLLFFQALLWILSVYDYQFEFFHQSSHTWILYTLCALYGIGDAVLNLLPPTLFGILFTEEKTIQFAFANYETIRMIGSAAIMFASPHFRFVTINITMTVLVALCMLSWTVLDLKYLTASPQIPFQSLGSKSTVIND